MSFAKAYARDLCAAIVGAVVISVIYFIVGWLG